MMSDQVRVEQEWTPLRLDFRKAGGRLVYYGGIGVVAFVMGIAVLLMPVLPVTEVKTGKLSPELDRVFPTMMALIGFGISVVAALQVRRWLAVKRFCFFEEGLAVASRGRRALMPGHEVTSAVISGMKNHGQAWHDLNLIFRGTRRVTIPLTPFLKQASLCDAIVARLPIAIERPKVPLKDG